MAIFQRTTSTVLCTTIIISMLLIIPIYSFNESLFIKSLLAGYDPLVRPSQNGADIYVTIHISPLLIAELDERKQLLKTAIAFTMLWQDNLLTWETVNSTITSLILPANYIWTPDIMISNSANTENQLDTAQSKAFVHNRPYYHHVILTVQNTYVTTCSVQVLKFPFDTQICKIYLIPDGGNASKIILRTDSNAGIDLAIFQNSSEWDLVDLSVRCAMRVETEALGTYFSIAIITFTMKRRALTHVVNSLFPVICLSLLNSFVFILPAGGGERTGVSISLLLSYAIYMTYINQTLPSNSDTLSYFSIYLVCLICKSSLIALATTISLWLHDKKKAQAVAWSLFTRTPSPKIIPEDQLMRRKTSAMKLQDMNSFGDDKFEQDSQLENTKVECTSHGARQSNEWSVRAIKFDWFCCIFFISCSLLMPTVCIALMLT
ncbi:neuronal acetylcholine receptor subunit non-alpha-2-like [Patella vulgata]|uniref:neuronal acetylcholine receptor subunit non-alpha-2-like n=1 Tax=Patella vulgata TaxID=6465 RepID=UPI0021807D82|nr:neuronal acetylcholine receptor subunit non-alpha-2-like [Patella vulgata]